jgi:anti-anti-sigma factor
LKDHRASRGSRSTDDRRATGMNAPRPFETRIRPDGLVYLSGELDMSTADPFSETVFSNLDGQQLVLDLSELTFLDSSGIRAILALAEARQQAVVVRNLRSNVRRVLDVAGVNEAMGVRIEPAT